MEQKITINNKLYKIMGKVHKREILKGNLEVPEGYTINLIVRKIKKINDSELIEKPEKIKINNRMIKFMRNAIRKIFY